MRRSPLQLFLIFALSALVFHVILIYTVTQLVFVPYVGFLIDSDGFVKTVLPQNGQVIPIQLGDQVVQIGNLKWMDYHQNLTQPLYPANRNGETLEIKLLHGDQFYTVPVITQPQPAPMVIATLVIALLAFAFWGFGLATTLLVRPHDTRWLTMILFCYLNALWLSAGSLSQSHLFFSVPVMLAAFWLNVPVSWHLHWVFPKLVKRLPFPILAAIYTFGAGMTVLQWQQIIPRNLYYLAFMLAALGSLALLGVHVHSHPEKRRQIRLLLLAVSLALLPSIFVSASGLLQISHEYSSLAIIFLPIIPATYFYTIYRQQLGGLELRVNRRITRLTYSLITFMILSVWFFFLGRLFGIHPIAILLAISSACLVSAFSILIFPSFQFWFETRVLGMPLPPTGLIEIYASQIVTSLDKENLVRLLWEEVLPSLLIRQAVILRLRHEEATPLLVMGVEPAGLPRTSEIPDVLKQAGDYRLTLSERELNGQICPWARLILVSAIENQPVCLFLLGKRDPDDAYASNEIPVFQSLANQTALALVNIDQAERLHMLHQSDIERSEAERIRLARILHDDVLNQLAVLRNGMEGDSPAKWEEAYQAAADHIREVITGLRPVMLVPYGLRAALVELIDLLNDTNISKTKVQADLASGDVRYPPAVELQLFRIAQQACENALKHSQAGTISLKGEFEPGRVNISIEDNGVGFAAGERLDLPWLLANKHFGLAGMYERAALIGAQLSVKSYDQQGTTVQVTWVSPPDLPEGK